MLSEDLAVTWFMCGHTLKRRRFRERGKARERESVWLGEEEIETREREKEVRRMATFTIAGENGGKGEPQASFHVGGRTPLWPSH